MSEERERVATIRQVETYQSGNFRIVIDERADEPVHVYERENPYTPWQITVQGTLHDPDLVRLMLKGKFRLILRETYG